MVSRERVCTRGDGSERHPPEAGAARRGAGTPSPGRDGGGGRAGPPEQRPHRVPGFSFPRPVPQR